MVQWAEQVFNLYITRYLKPSHDKQPQHQQSWMLMAGPEAVCWWQWQQYGGQITMMCLQFKFMRNGEVINVIIMTVVNIGFIAGQPANNHLHRLLLLLLIHPRLFLQVTTNTTPPFNIFLLFFARTGYDNHFVCLPVRYLATITQVHCGCWCST